MFSSFLYGIALKSPVLLSFVQTWRTCAFDILGQKKHLKNACFIWCGNSSLIQIYIK